MTDYTTMEGWQLIQECADDASKWAAAFRQTAMKLGYSDMDEGWLIGWFANAMQTNFDIRCGTLPVLLPDGSGFFVADVPMEKAQ